MFPLSFLRLSAAQANTFMPPAATEIASQVDDIYAFLLWASLISFVLLIGGMIWFVVKYKRRTGADKSEYITHNHTLEFLWSFIPFCIFIFVFAWGWLVYHRMRSFPENALEVHVVGKKWDWRFIYKNGKEVVAGVDDKGNRTPATMVVPQGRPVKLIMASEKINAAGNDPYDRPVLHSFFVPAFRIKQDVVPGRYTALWFQADKKGDFHVFCTEYCGAGHSAMSAAIKVVSVEDYENWLSSDIDLSKMSLAEQGKALYASKACIGCHSLNGTRLVGPSWKGIFGTEVAHEGGKKHLVNEDFLRESILNPNAQIAQGYPSGQMPPYAGQLSDEEVNALIEFIKTVK